MSKGHDFEVVTFRDAGHELFSVPRDTVTERFRSPGFTSEALPTVRRWLHARVP
jgi:hypothetical protein